MISDMWELVEANLHGFTDPKILGDFGIASKQQTSPQVIIIDARKMLVSKELTAACIQASILLQIGF